MVRNMSSMKDTGERIQHINKKLMKVENEVVTSHAYWKKKWEMVSNTTEDIKSQAVDGDTVRQVAWDTLQDQRHHTALELENGILEKVQTELHH